jgi:hypothetical protein
MIKTNKVSLIKSAVQGEITSALVQRNYITTWDGRPKLAVGIGGINYNIGIGDHVFGWANGDRVEPGVATVGTGDKEEWKMGFRNFSCIGNEVRVLDGEGKSGKGLIIGKHGYLPSLRAHHVNVHFEHNILENLAIGDKVQVKAWGTGLKIEGFEDVRVIGLDPELLESLGIKDIGGKLQVPVVKEIPHEIVGEGSGGRPVEQGNWNIQTCYPPDIEEYGLDELRFGDIVLLKDIQSDWGRGQYKGGATVGVVSAGPSEMSGRGIGVTTILSTRFGKLLSKIDSKANIGYHLGIEISKKKKPKYVPPTFSYPKPSQEIPSGALKTNKDILIMTAVQGVVQPPASRGYSITWDGKPKLGIGMASINYNVSVGDLAYGYANADHVEPDVTIQGRDKPNPSDCALAILSCIGNEATVISGDAKGEKGIFIGRHAGADDMVWFPKSTIEKLALDDKIQIKAVGAGLKIEGFEDVKLNKMSPTLLENMGILIENGKLVVPVVIEVPGWLMGSGIGWSPSTETVDYDIQTTCPEYVEEFDLKKLRLGDIVAIKDHYDAYGRGRYKDAITIGVIIHGFSDFGGHGPGVNPVMTALPGRIRTTIEPLANTSTYLGLREKPTT